MQCKKCNSFIPEGYLYCPVCGDEVIIVSDFEIHLEDNIDMSSIADTFDVSQDTKEIVKDALPNEFAITKDLTINSIGNINNSKMSDKKVSNDRVVNNNKARQDDNNKNLIKIFSFIIIVLAILASIGIVIGVNISRYYSYEYQYNKAVDYVADKDYEDAIKTCKHLITLGNDKKGKLLFADCYMAQNNYDAAIAVLYATLDDYPDDYSLIDMIIKCYEMEGDSKGISDLISSHSDSTLALRYSDYISMPPAFSLDEGSYVEPDPIKLSAIGEGQIYYTVDGSEPTVDSLSYVGPIPLEPGENTISAIFLNEKGLVSEVVTKKYIVELNIPDDPILLVNSGSKTIPELIGVQKEEGVTIYYCEGNGEPTINSKVYTSPFLMPIGKSSYSFIAINENGQSSSVVVGEYNLSLNGAILPSVAEYAISYQLLSKGENVIANTYMTNYGYSDSNRTYYIIDEYSLDALTGRKFAVDVSTGELFSFITNPDGSFSTLPL